jgi:hypothetical protein
MPRSDRFETTLWSVVRAAGGDDSAAARRAFRRRLRAAVAETVGTDAEIDDEIDYLLKAIVG